MTEHRNIHLIPGSPDAFRSVDLAIDLVAAQGPDDEARPLLRVVKPDDVATERSPYEVLLGEILTEALAGEDISIEATERLAYVLGGLSFMARTLFRIAAAEFAQRCDLDPEMKPTTEAEARDTLLETSRETIEALKNS